MTTSKQFLAARKEIPTTKSKTKEAWNLLSSRQRKIFSSKEVLTITALFLVAGNRFSVHDVLQKYKYGVLMYAMIYGVIFRLKLAGHVKSFRKNGWYDYELTESGIELIKNAQGRLDKYRWSWYEDLL